MWSCGSAAKRRGDTGDRRPPNAGVQRSHRQTAKTALLVIRLDVWDWYRLRGDPWRATPHGRSFLRWRSRRVCILAHRRQVHEPPGDSIFTECLGVPTGQWIDLRYPLIGVARKIEPKAEWRLRVMCSRVRHFGRRATAASIADVATREIGVSVRCPEWTTEPQL